ncbi:Flavin-dependent oxidoreductase, luciferase family (includes alkanesulfonate monooxygenase SsuD and methylene tetrahydromethanopterin reductase) [Actinopolyspora lacussalsi subsp. righensis]|uniref:Flavin-dependent oxidoreductase, luciferase family (Includes alkanesulfonate monooxygenase SsuD and methylene tetrahydromethanopterin reductase) n=1 Tax=Actinopolyspora righensis TaxID=995060 RepID=A0A1I6XDV5_9ACTN|nr:LLM class flavin-dependent oxidoreductase [Actinopolyspora righensis]SFT36291.1 Flavin-dependent oxidoreductase, luciferase family (includes alkanesulfonate monooxygenase SsuD and methylene tetrahydromethanopterin reductase) [Actinopolyspora righensis]
MSALADDPNNVKFIYWDNITYSPPGSRAPEEWEGKLGAELYKSYLDHCVDAERLGYAGVSMPEHFGPSSPIPHPVIMMAALAVKTKSARIISGANIPLWHEPMELAEQLAMIDVLSGGRLEVGLGRHGDRVTQDNAVDLIDGVLHNVDHPVAKADLRPMQAAFLQDAEIANFNAWPRPVQKRVPLWAPASTEGSLEAAARRGMSVFTGLNTNPTADGVLPITLDEVGTRLQRYIEIGQETGHDLSMANVAVTCYTAVADTDKEAADIVRDGFINHVQAASEHTGRLAGTIKPGQDSSSLAELENEDMKAILEAPAESYLRNPFALVGSVETVREKLEALMSAGMRRFVVLCGGVGTQHEIGWQTAKALAEDVAPDLFASARAEMSTD